MRAVDIDLARGSDQSIDPRVAPQGTVARALNCRIDKLGRLVPRNGYVSLGTTVHAGAGAQQTLVPFDLHNVDGELVALGNNSAANQTGIRAAYRYVGNTQGVWRTEMDAAGANSAADLLALPAADQVSIALSEINATAADENVADAAATADGAYVAMTCMERASTVVRPRLSIISAATGEVVAFTTRSNGDSNPRLLAIGQVFYWFYQNGTTINVRTMNMALTSPVPSGATAVATVTSAAPAAYDVAPLVNGTDYLIAYPTATGYTWRRFNSANVQQTTTNVASLADAPVSICGGAAETVSVINVRAANGAELRTFNLATGVLAVGPTNLDTSGTVMVWVGLERFSPTQVYAVFYRDASPETMFASIATTAAHVLTVQVSHIRVRPITKPLLVDGNVFMWESLSNAAPAPYGLVACGVTGAVPDGALAAVALDGIAKVAPFNAGTQGYKSAIVRGGTSTVYYAALIGLDPRDKAYRAYLMSFELFSGKRRQGVTSAGTLYLAGGTTTQFDKRVAYEVGFDTTPRIESLTQTIGGSLTLLGAYTFQLVFRCVAANGDVTQSAPSAPASLTLTGGNNSIDFNAALPFSARVNKINQANGVVSYIDVYRTEAGGSIPRLSKSVPYNGTLTFGALFAVNDGNADTVVQAGNTLYTQGADGSVSGRLPLGLASPCRFISEVDGKLVLGGLERDSQLHLSVESRPGEAAGFVNDDLFFIQNPERVTAVVAGDGGRRYIFGRSNIRELVGPGPNAAGVGDISEPVEIENRVGCTDWRGVVKTEHGVFFPSSALGRPKIYLLPASGGGALDAGAGIEDVLTDYPVITSATRHDEEQLVTFTLQDTAGTDGRIVHLDLRTSGMGKGGWVGRWLVDRVTALEAAGRIEIVEELVDLRPFAAPSTITVNLPTGKRIGDRVLIVASAQGATTTLSTPTSYTLIGTTASAGSQVRVWERLLTTASGAQANTLTFTLGVSSSALCIRVWVLRGAHASQAAETVVLASASVTSHVLPTLTPTWGSANNLWFSVATADTAFPLSSGVQLPIWRVYPTSFERGAFSATTEGGNALASMDQAACSRQLTAGSLATVTWTSGVGTPAGLVLIAVRPLAAAGTPVRASTQFRGRLVVCNSTDVLQSDPTATGDAGTIFVQPELELCDIYPMGTGGAGRHLAIVLILELLGFCVITPYVSYDNGVNWTALRSTSLHSAVGYAVGKVVRLSWTPKRRKVESVRVKFEISEDAAFGATGPTAGAALLRCQLIFEDLVGASRLPAQQRGGLST